MANIISSTGVYPRSVETSKKRYQYMSHAQSGRMQVRSTGAARRQFIISYPPMTRAEFATVWAFIDALNGSATTFEVYVPDVTSSAAFDWAAGTTGVEEVTVRLMSEIQEFAIDHSDFYEYEIDCVEVVL